MFRFTRSRRLGVTILTGYLAVLSNASAQFTPSVGSGVEVSGELVTEGTQRIELGGRAIEGTVGVRGAQRVWGSTTDMTVDAAGRQDIEAGGYSLGTRVNDSGAQFIYFNGRAERTTVATGGWQYVLPTALVIDTQLIGGSQNLAGTATGTFIAGGGTQFIFDSALATGTIIGASGSQIVQVNGLARDTTVDSGGVQVIQSGGRATDTAIRAGGVQEVWGLAESTRIEAAGLQRVNSGGQAFATSVAGGGRVWVGEGGLATAPIVLSTGILEVAPGGIARSVDQRLGGALITSTDASVSGVNPMGAFSVSAALQQADSVLLESGGILRVGANGVATGTMVGSGGSLLVDGGGVLRGSTVLSGSGQVFGSTIRNEGMLTFRNSQATTSASLSGIGGIRIEGESSRVALAGRTDQAQGITLTGGSLTLLGQHLASAAPALMLNGPGPMSARIDAAVLESPRGLIVADAAGTTTAPAKLDISNTTLTSSNLIRALNGSTLDVTVVNSRLFGNVEFDQSSSGWLRLTSSSQLTGVIDPVNVAVDASSLWKMTGNSVLGTLQLAGQVDFGERGDPLSPRTLTVTNLQGQDGLIAMNARLAKDAGPSDRIVIDRGTVSGTTQLAIRNAGGLGAETQANGIMVVESRNGGQTTAQTTRDGFRLAGPVTAGVYEYRLTPGDRNGSGENWYLRSDVSIEGVSRPSYRPEVAALPAYMDQSRQMSLLSLGTLSQRRGFPQNDGYGDSSWGRGIAQYVERQGDGPISPEWKANIAGIQAGTDVWNEAGTSAGLYLSVLGTQMRSTGFIRGSENGSAGDIQNTSPALGLYLTHFWPSGYYVDAVVQGSRYIGDSNLRGTGWATSLEIGRSFGVAADFRLQPQAQLIYQKLDFDTIEFNDLGRTKASLDMAGSFVYRLGIQGQWHLETTDRQHWNPYLGLNLWSRSNGNTETTFRTPDLSVSLNSSFGEPLAEVSGGVTGAIREKFFVYGQFGYGHALSGNDRSFGASAGLRIAF